MRLFSRLLTVYLPVVFFQVSALVAVSSADFHAAKVVSIADGDTVTAVLSGGQSVDVRLEGIDAPEHGQAFAPASEKHLSELMLGKAVTLDCTALDPYQRLVCKILLPNGEDVDLDQIKAGMAWHYKQYQRLQSATDRAAYGAAEDAARRARLGLWADAQPMQPQDFPRDAKRALPRQSRSSDRVQ
jgi:endonuclease YncB( thermonuclease family)